MRSRLKETLKNAVIVVGVVALYLGLQEVRPRGDALGGAVFGQAAPDFEATDLAGRPFRLAETRGKVALVVFWATWCAPCVREVPALNALHDALHDKGLEVVGLNVEVDDVPQVREFVRERDVRYRVVIDDGSAARAWGLVTLPSLALVGRDGVVRWKTAGSVSERELRARVTELL
jgi:peroxiredoxin